MNSTQPFVSLFEEVKVFSLHNFSWTRACTEHLQICVAQCFNGVVTMAVKFDSFCTATTCNLSKYADHLLLSATHSKGPRKLQRTIRPFSSICFSCRQMI